MESIPMFSLPFPWLKMCPLTPVCTSAISSLHWRFKPTETPELRAKIKPQSDWRLVHPPSLITSYLRSELCHYMPKHRNTPKLSVLYRLPVFLCPPRTAPLPFVAILLSLLPKIDFCSTSSLCYSSLHHNSSFRCQVTERFYPHPSLKELLQPFTQMPSHHLFFCLNSLAQTHPFRMDALLFLSLSTNVT